MAKQQHLAAAGEQEAAEAARQRRPGQPNRKPCALAHAQQAAQRHAGEGGQADVADGQRDRRRRLRQEGVGQATEGADHAAEERRQRGCLRIVDADPREVRNHQGRTADAADRRHGACDEHERAGLLRLQMLLGRFVGSSRRDARDRKRGSPEGLARHAGRHGDLEDRDQMQNHVLRQPRGGRGAGHDTHAQHGRQAKGRTREGLHQVADAPMLATGQGAGHADDAQRCAQCQSRNVLRRHAGEREAAEQRRHHDQSAADAEQARHQAGTGADGDVDRKGGEAVYVASPG